MSLSTIVSIAISLTLIYLILSVVTSEIQEIITSLLNLRAKNLQQSIINLLGEQQNEGNLIKNFFNDILGTRENGENSPITNKLYEKYLTPYLNLSKGKASKYTAVSNIQSEKFARGLIETVREVLEQETEALSQEEEISHEAKLQKVIDDIQKSSLPEKLKTDFSYLLQKSNSKLNKTDKELQYLESAIQDWFDESMQYASEIYKKKSKFISFSLGLVLVLLFNIDAINIIDQLSKSEILVSTFNNTAVELINSNISSCSDVGQEINIENCITDIQEQLNIALDNIDNLPIGWNFSAPFKEQFSPLNIPNILEAFVGWFISALAISMGAPFWFTVLRNIVNFKSNQTSKASKVKEST